MKLSERCKDMVKGNTQYTIAEWQETLLKAADELDRLERFVGCCRGQISEAIDILENGTKYEKRHVVAILDDALKAIGGPS